MIGRQGVAGSVQSNPWIASAAALEPVLAVDDPRHHESGGFTTEGKNELQPQPIVGLVRDDGELDLVGAKDAFGDRDRMPARGCAEPCATPAVRGQQPDMAIRIDQAKLEPGPNVGQPFGNGVEVDYFEHSSRFTSCTPVPTRKVLISCGPKSASMVRSMNIRRIVPFIAWPVVS